MKKIIYIALVCIAAYAVADLVLIRGHRANDYKGQDRALADLLAADGSEASSSPRYFAVDHVVDGDTLVVRSPPGLATIRLIGMNTPETVDPRKPLECFGPEASARAHEVFDGGEVGLVADPAEGGLDIYGRVLAYAYTKDGALYNQDMIASGYAYEYTFKAKYGHQKDFKAAQAVAKKAKLGLWSPSTCNGRKKK